MTDKHVVVPLGDGDPQRDRSFAEDMRAQWKEKSPAQTKHTRAYYHPAIWDVRREHGET